MSLGIKELEAQIEAAQYDITLSEALRSLLENKDFQLVFLEDYMNKEVVRLVMSKGDPRLSNADSQAALDRAIAGTSGLKVYLRELERKGEAAVNIITNAKADIHEIIEGEKLEDE